MHSIYYSDIGRNDHSNEKVTVLKLPKPLFAQMAILCWQMIPNNAFSTVHAQSTQLFFSNFPLSVQTILHAPRIGQKKNGSADNQNQSDEHSPTRICKNT